MERLLVLVIAIHVLTCLQLLAQAEESVLSAVLTPSKEPQEKTLSRQGRSYYYDYRYGVPRPLYERLEYRDYDRSRCGRCDDRYDDRDDYDRPGRDRPDDDRRHRPTYGSRNDRNKNNDDDDDRDRRYNSDRKGQNKNGTDDENDKKYDDKDKRPNGSRRDRYDDRDRYRPDYYDRFLRDPYDRPYYNDDIYRERRPIYDRYPYDRYDDSYGGRYDGYGYPGYRRSYYDGYDKGGYDDAFGGYGPGAGRGPHDSFRPWDETYRGQAGWDAGGRGYYFASGRPEAAPASGWGRPEYNRPQTSTGWQSAGYSGYRDPVDYRGSFGYQDTGYRQGSAGYGQPSGWHSVGERRPYRDQSGVNQLDNREKYPSRTDSGRYGQSGHGQLGNSYGQANSGYSGQSPSAYGNSGNNYGQNSGDNYGQNSGKNYGQSSTTPATSYLYQREDEQVTVKDVTTKSPS